MKFNGSLVSTISVDLGLYRASLHKVMEEALAVAAFEWLDAVIKVIPQWSGASAATFLNLARKIDFPIPITPAANAPSRIGIGTSSGEGDFTLDDARGQYTFRYATTLKHLVYNESHNANTERSDPAVFHRLRTPGPYHFQELGQAAFRASIRGVRLPPPIYRVSRISLR